MNWEVGLFRLWLVAWAGWAVFAFGVTAMQRNNHHNDYWRSFLEALEVSILPGVAVFLLTFGVLWIIRGFRRRG